MDNVIDIIIKQRAAKKLNSGYLWVFSNEIVDIIKSDPGVFVNVIDENENSYGLAIYNPHSLIALRLLNTNTLPDNAFFIDRINSAKLLREWVLPDENSYRLVFGESDLLSGLIIDKYGDYFSVQIQSAGMEKMIDSITGALLELFPDTKGIIAKNNSRAREIEGLQSEDRILFGAIPDNIPFSENDINLSISLKQGQKTGYFLDQRPNRNFIGSIAKGARVLDCFCNQGGFALSALKGGADYALGIDISESVIDRAEINAEMNSFNNYSFQTKDVFDFLKNDNEKWDIIILDPPAFAKNRKTVPAAKKGYARINSLAMQKLNPGGILATSSCSHHIFEDVFHDVIIREAAKLGRQLQLIYRGQQGVDHPILPPMPETRYLKFFAFAVL